MSYTIERYPTRWIDVWQLPDGRRLTVRPVLPQDAELEQALVRALSPASRYQRFFSPIRELPAGWLERLTQIDYRLQQAFIVETFVGDQALAVAEAPLRGRRIGRQLRIRRGRGRRLAAPGAGAPADAVPDAQRRRGGLKRMTGDVLATNQAMLSLARSLGFQVVRHPDGGAMVHRVQRALAGMAADGLGAAAALTAPAPSAPPAWAAT